MFCSLITFNAMAKEGLTSMNANSKDTLVTVTRDVLRDKWQTNGSAIEKYSQTCNLSQTQEGE